MSETRQLIEDVQKQTNADDRALATARERRNDTLAIGRTFSGVTTSYRSGSVAAGVVAGLVHDADGGIVLDRRSYPSLGPDGDGESPDDVVADLQAFLGPKLREIYPNAVVR